MTKQAKTASIDMVSGPLFKKIIIFVIPVMLSNMLQMLYNAADQAVVGQFAGSDALAAVGSTSSLFNLIVCLVTGLSVGTSTVVARLFGAGNSNAVSRAVHTSVVISLISGIIIGAFGFVFCRPLLILMDTHPDVLDAAVLYMRILFAGLPFTAVYNFGSAILRAVGDTRHPMYFLIISGLVNVILNLFFVICFGMSVDGVALATIISQMISSTLTVIWLIRSDGSYKLIPRNIRFYKSEAFQIIRIGLPAGIQSSMFSFANIVLQSSVNSLGKAVVSGSAAASTVENLVYQAMNALYHATLSFCGQNYGAKKYDRIMKSFLYCVTTVSVIGIVIGPLCYIFGEQLLSIFIDNNPEAVAAGLERNFICCNFYFLCGIMEVGAGALRAMNRPIHSTINSILGACVLRVVWAYTVFLASPSVFTLYLSYPISWGLTALLHVSMFLYFFKKSKKDHLEREAEKA